MANYADREAVRTIVQRLPSSVDGNASMISDEAIDEAITAGSAKIDARLSDRYTTPFDPVPELIRWICMAYAAWASDLTFRENRDMESELNPNYQRWRDAEAMLEQLATGASVIPPEGTEPDPGIGTRVVSTLTRGTLIDVNDFDIDRSTSVPDYSTPEGWAIH